MEPVTYQPQSQFGIGFEDQGIYGKTMGQTSTLSGMEKLNQANEITILHKRITCTESNNLMSIKKLISKQVKF